MEHDEQPPLGIGAVERRRWVERKRREVAAASRTGHLGLGAFGASSATADHVAGWEQRHWTNRLLHRLGAMAAHSGSGTVAAGLIVVWVFVGVVVGFPGWWQTMLYSVTASVTFVMVFVIQHTQERQTSATQRKLTGPVDSGN